MKILQNIYLAIVIFVLSLFLFGYALVCHELSAPSGKVEEKTIEIKPGGIDSIASTLYQEGLIRNRYLFILYAKVFGKNNMKAATYTLSTDMDTREIIKILSEGKGSNSKEISITFKEGWNVRRIAKAIEENTNHTVDEVYNTLADEDFLKRMIVKYWFLDDEILNKEIYYPLEGYLSPDTYNYSSKDEDIEVILEKMIAETSKKIESKKDEIASSSKSIQEIFTLASIVELEGNTLEDRKGIAGVFQNRLLKGMNLGSDVTTYYGARVDMGERDLYASEVNACNSYNTRCPSFKRLPVSPICNPSLDSIIAALEPDDSEYLYFVADKNMKIYFSKTLNEHNNKIRELKEKNLWLEY